jgi:hypothetical protein
MQPWGCCGGSPTFRRLGEGQVRSAGPAALEVTVQGVVWMREIVSEVGLVAQIEVPAGAIA